MKSIGSDVEVLLRDRESNLVSSIGLIGGDKIFPFNVEKGNLQEDNVLAEFAIEPATSKEEFVTNINTVLGSLKAKIGELDLQVDISSSAIYPPCQLEHPLARQFGCDPDYDGWTGNRNRRPRPQEVGRLRTCGGHIHVGFDFEGDGDEEKRKLIQWMDAYLGLPSVMLDTDRRRRTVYGRSGAYRDKEYGVEYRVLSNFWIRSEELMAYVYDQTQKAYDRMLQGSILDHLNEEDVNGLRVAIDTGDQKEAAKYMDMLEVGNF